MSTPNSVGGLCLGFTKPTRGCYRQEATNQSKTKNTGLKANPNKDLKRT